MLTLMDACLFRGKRPFPDEWVIGRGVIIDEIGFVKIFDDNRNEWFKVIPETFGMFVGVEDIHGKKIFSGDIVKREYVWGWTKKDG